MVATNPNNSRYAQMAAEAEAAVTAVKDPELRRVAFEKILAQLLEGEQPVSGSPQRKRKVGQPKQHSVPASNGSEPKAKKGPNSPLKKSYLRRP